MTSDFKLQTADVTHPIFERVTIVGLGLIGGSIALAARELWPSSVVSAVDRPEVLEAARRTETIDVALDDVAAIGDADLIILAAPVRQNAALLSRLSANLPHGTVVTDTGSTKREIVEVSRTLPQLTFVGGHPLGGSTASGLEHARADLFRGRPWLFTPHQPGNGEVVGRLIAFAAALGAKPRVVGVEEHDRLMAFVSHLPQLTASALMEIVGAAVGGEGLAMAGRGLVDTTRLAGSSSAIWRDITASNADQIAPALDLLIARLKELRLDLGRGDRLTEVFDEAARWRQRLAAEAKRDA